MAGFTTILVAPDRPALAAECVGRHLVGRPVVGEPIEAVVVLRNTGAEAWPAGAIRLGLTGIEGKGRARPIPSVVPPGSCATVTLKLPASENPGYVTHFTRLRSLRGREFGPVFAISATVSDPDAPRKLVAFRELGHVRLKWFGPEREPAAASYAIERADGFLQDFHPLDTAVGTEYLDANLQPDHVYYYRVAAVDRRGRRSRPSNEDNARALSRPWTWDAEVVSHTVPGRMKLGQSESVRITLRNTGRKAWDLTHGEGGTRFVLTTTQLWGEQNEDHLPRVEISGAGPVEPGQEVTLTLPYAPIRAGRFENHWVLTMETKASGRVYFGTPLLVETHVAE
jgi:hypothetical protein